MRLRYKIGLIVLVLGSVFALGRCGGRSTGPKATLPAVLPPNDKEVVSYNENRHTLTVMTAKGTTTQYSRNPEVEIRKDGTVKIDAKAWGFEARPFLGIGYSDTGRLYAGCNLFYVHSFDAAASFGWTANANKPAFQPMLSIGWNFWSNSSLNVGINPLTIAGMSKPQPAIFLSVRL